MVNDRDPFRPTRRALVGSAGLMAGSAAGLAFGGAGEASAATAPPGLGVVPDVHPGPVARDVDQSPAIQAALDAVGPQGGVVSLQPGRVYNCLSPIRIDTTRHIIQGNGATLDFSARRFPSFADAAELVADPALSGGPDWRRGDAATADWSLGDGATFRPAEPGTVAVLVQPVRLEKGTRYRIAFEAEAREPGTPAGLVSLEVRSPDGRQRIMRVTGDAIDLAPGPFDLEFVWAGETGPADFVLTADTPVTLRTVSLRRIPEDRCLILETPAGGTQYGHAPHGMYNLTIRGRGRDAGIGIHTSTQVEALSTRYTIANCDIVGLKTGLALGDRTYLVRLVNSDIYDCGTCYDVLGGDDMGENLTLWGCTLFNSDTAIRNRGGLVHAFGCSLDYCRTFVHMTGGYLHTFGCHFERTEATDPVSHPFRIFGESEFHIYAGYIQINDFVEPTVQTHIFHLGQPRTRLFLRDVRAWGLKTASGELVSGQGQVVGLLTGIGGRNISPFIKRDEAHNLIPSPGDPQSGRIDWNVTVYGGNRTDRYRTDFLAASVSGDVRRGGSPSLALSKRGTGLNDNAYSHILIPLPPERGSFSMEFHARLGGLVGEGQGSWFAEIAWVQIAGLQPDGAPVIAKRAWNGEKRMDFQREAGETDWERVIFSTLYDDDSTPGTDGRRPVWATHMAVSLQLAGLPGGSILYLTDATANMI